MGSLSRWPEQACPMLPKQETTTWGTASLLQPGCKGLTRREKALTLCDWTSGELTASSACAGNVSRERANSLGRQGARALGGPHPWTVSSICIILSLSLPDMGFVAEVVLWPGLPCSSTEDAHGRCRCRNPAGGQEKKPSSVSGLLDGKEVPGQWSRG